MSVTEAKPLPAAGDMTSLGLYRKLREQILNGDLPPGAAVSQAGLAARLGVTRTPLREALRLLQQEGLIDAQFNRQVRVTGLSMDELEQLYAQRILHEVLALRLSVPLLSPEEFDELRGLHTQMLELATPETFVQWEQVHRRFHSLLVSHSGDRLQSFVTELADHGRRYRHQLLDLGGGGPSVYGPGMPEHLTIVEACEQRDEERAGQLLARHLGRTALTLVSLRDPTHEPRAVREALRLAIPGGGDGAAGASSIDTRTRPGTRWVSLQRGQAL